MQSLTDDPDIREAPFSLEEKLTIQQVRFVASRLRDLLVRYESASPNDRLKPNEWPEWSAFIDAAYSCGFVCHDAGEDMGDRDQTPVSESVHWLEDDVSRVDGLGLRDLRRVLHYIIRSERWGDGGGGTGGGAVWQLITSRLGDVIARRLGA